MHEHVRELVQGGGTAADELMEAIVVEHAHHLVSVFDGQRGQGEPLGDDGRVLVVKADHAAVSC